MKGFEKTDYFDVTVVLKIFPENHGTGSIRVEEMYLYVVVFFIYFPGVSDWL